MIGGINITDRVKVYTLGQSVSKMGDRIYSLILPVLYAYYFSNPYAATVISGGYSIGGILGSSLGIKIGDKYNYKIWPVYLNFLQMIIALLMTILLTNGNNSILLYGAFSFSLGISLSLIQAFNGKYIYSLGTDKMIKKIASIRIAGDNFGVAVGAVLSGIVIRYKMFSIATLINAITFLISAVIIININRDETRLVDTKEKIKTQKVEKNNRKLSRNENKPVSIIFLLIFNFMICIITQPTVFLVTKSLIEVSQDWKIEFLITTYGVFSAIIGCIIYFIKKLNINKNYGIFMPWAFFALAMMVVPIINSKFLIIVLGGVWAFTQTIYSIFLESTLVEIVDKTSRGRLFANMRLSRQLANPFGFMIAGFLVSNQGGLQALKWMMFFLLGICIIFYILKKILLVNLCKEGEVEPNV